MQAVKARVTILSSTFTKLKLAAKLRSSISYSKASALCLKLHILKANASYFCIAGFEAAEVREDAQHGFSLRPFVRSACMVHLAAQGLKRCHRRHA